MNYFEKDWIYDCETYPNCITFAFQSSDGSQNKLFEISSRQNDLDAFLEFCRESVNNSYRWVGFNNQNFDYPVVHWILLKAIDAKSKNKQLKITPKQIYNYAMKVIESKRGGSFGITVKQDDIFIKQLDLFKMCHFDNKAKMTSLKLLEFNMRLSNIEDLPFVVGKHLESDEIDTLIEYNKWDVQATKEFYHYCYDAIKFRKELTDKYGFDCTNLNDSKIGEQFFIRKIEKDIPDAFTYVDHNGRTRMKQTPRDQIVIKDCIFKYVQFNSEPFKEIKKWFEKQVISETNGVFSDIEEHLLGDVAKYAEMVVKRVKFKSKPTEEEIAEFKKIHPLGWIEEIELKTLETLKDENGVSVKEQYVCEKSGKTKSRVVKVQKRTWDGCFNVAETLNVVINGFRYDFGVGGIHGSISGVVTEDDEYELWDWDVNRCSVLFTPLVG